MTLRTGLSAALIGTALALGARVALAGEAPAGPMLQGRAVLDEAVKAFAHVVAIGCDAAAVTTLAAGAGTAVWRMVWKWGRYSDLGFKKDVWLRFASTIVLALEFALAADIADTTVAPNWREIGQLAAIAGIRTVLNLFLERDINAFEPPRPPPS
jgi:uncharacterized membrane protein